jgi:hypothetical protein
MTTEDNSDQSKRALTAKERARAFRKAAYEKAKAAAKERRAAMAATPEARQRAADQKAKRREVYKRAKERSNALSRRSKAATLETKDEARAQTEEVRQKDLLKLITTADKLLPPQPKETKSQPKLTLVKS